MTMGSQARAGHDYQVMTHKYILPLVEQSGCVPLLVPTCCGVDDLDHYLDMADGLYLTGAGSNIDPGLYGQENLTPEKQQDQERDRVDIALIHGALARGLPIFGICRGMQELNVALGGDLYQKVYSEEEYEDHREDSTASVDEQYGESHAITLVEGEWLRQVLGSDTIMVNSLHGQGLCRLGEGLHPLAYAEDGLVEAVGMKGGAFVLGVQWHPEWKASENPYSIRLFKAFGEACRARIMQRKPRLEAVS
ncbi:gamma-glutamyl-gamma-aminobutyrate hydrolase family protein [Aeromonas schubertii]|uniref:gamma-glutamyl-gamma-aminobutyrate hydrolase family protein n=1 Tax=Aeromonas schubertii TaxID=652 RepID=UPI001D046E69|nr:gamma-glutamyl-gamma-aminobutyrate hydrolase family protein [Aeromonas schubertii]